MPGTFWSVRTPVPTTVALRFIMPVFASVKVCSSSVPWGTLLKFHVVPVSSSANTGLGSSWKLERGRAAVSRMLPCQSVKKAITM
jgi:hypothetical protein